MRENTKKPMLFTNLNEIPVTEITFVIQVVLLMKGGIHVCQQPTVVFVLLKIKY